MGNCAGTKQKKTDGDLHKIVAQVKQSGDWDGILKAKVSDSQNFNPYKNPIIGRRLHNLCVSQTVSPQIKNNEKI